MAMSGAESSVPASMSAPKAPRDWSSPSAGSERAIAVAAERIKVPAPDEMYSGKGMRWYFDISSRVQALRTTTTNAATRQIVLAINIPSPMKSDQ